MQFSTPLTIGRLIRRYKRFLADVELESGEVITAHTANTGSMLGCCTPGSWVWLSRSQNPKRKYIYTWELVQIENDVLVGINTGLANQLVKEAIVSGVIGELSGYSAIRREVPYGKERSRIDLLLEATGLRPDCYVEVKNVTTAQNKSAIFPDAVSARGVKHLRELVGMVEQGYRAVIFFCIQRGDASEFKPADSIDPVYGETLRMAVASGVEALAYISEITPSQIALTRGVPVMCD
ncbi:MAG: DNA/RNA nuclease SfsA [Gammaproteobacteria bacterium]|nr:DNA/RNA nuclease SfsA [Gammaproteobacteria bacterium]